jgi:coatomer subunit beta
MLNGDAQTGLLMHIIRFVMPSKSKPLKKLMYFFFEVCPKHDAQGKLRQEWILVWLVEDLGNIVRADADYQK